jgi:hypothetical protein
MRGPARRVAQGARTRRARAPRTPAGPTSPSLGSARDALAFLRRRRTAEQVRETLRSLNELARTMKRRDAAVPDAVWRRDAPKALRHVEALQQLGASLRVWAELTRLPSDLQFLAAVLRDERPATRLGERVRFARFISAAEKDAGVRAMTVREVMAWAILAGVEESDPSEDDTEAWKKAWQRARRRGHSAESSGRGVPRRSG